MNKTLIILALTVLAGYSKQAETRTAVGTEFVVDKLFTHEGCTVYRFSDGGPCDWFNDTKPMVMEQLAKIRKDLAEQNRTKGK